MSTHARRVHFPLFEQALTIEYGLTSLVWVLATEIGDGPLRLPFGGDLRGEAQPLLEWGSAGGAGSVIGNRQG